MIELAPEEYRQLLPYNEAVMYCFSLNIDGKVGWRLPTRTEFLTRSDIFGWWYSHDAITRTNRGIVIPVRDLKDD